MSILSHQETGIKQDVIAIRVFEKEISEALSNLFITEYSDVNVLSVYSDLTGNLLAYKVIKSSLDEEPWLHAGFNRINYVDFHTGFSFIPGKFMTIEADGTGPEQTEIGIEYPITEAKLHYSKGLLKYHGTKKDHAVYLYRILNTYAIFVFKGRNCVFANSFNCTNELELLYFIVNSIDLNGMRQDEVSLYLDYSMLRNEKTMEFLKPYFLGIYPLKVENPAIDTMLPFLPEMLFPNQLLSLCVSSAGL
jgi:hypothetical protein